jgi:hypothetical protein
MIRGGMDTCMVKFEAGIRTMVFAHMEKVESAAWRHCRLLLQRRSSYRN